MTSCWGVKNFVTSQSGETGNAAEGVPHFEMSTTLSAPMSSAGTSARCTQRRQYVFSGYLKTTETYAPEPDRDAVDVELGRPHAAVGRVERGAVAARLLLLDGAARVARTVRRAHFARLLDRVRRHAPVRRVDCHLVVVHQVHGLEDVCKRVSESGVRVRGDARVPISPLSGQTGPFVQNAGQTVHPNGTCVASNTHRLPRS